MRTRWKLQNLGRWAGLLALSVGVTVLVFLGGIVLLAWQTGEGQAYRRRTGAIRSKTSICPRTPPRGCCS